MCTLDFMDYWLKTIYAHTSDNTNCSVHNTRLSPPVFIVGTHRNSLASDPEIQEMLVWHTFYSGEGDGGWLSGQGHWSLTTSLRSQMWAYPLIPSPVLWFPYTYQWLGFTDWFVITVMFLLIWDSVGLMINYNWKLIDLRYPHSLFIQLIVNAHNQLITPKKSGNFPLFI